ncbi:MAG: FHA domain-containing protein, partial [Acidobacteriota bacterium]
MGALQTDRPPGVSSEPTLEPAALATRVQRPASDAGFVLEVIEGPMDGVLFAGDPEVARIGRNPGNDLFLHADPHVSGNHLFCHRSGDAQSRVLADQGSSNGTFVDGERLGGPHPVRFGDTFVLGYMTVVRCRANPRESSRGISPETLYRDKLRLYESFSPALRQSFGAAAMLACQERRGFVNDRHLFLGLASSCADLPIFARGKGPVPQEFLDHILLQPGAWTEIEDWVVNHLKTHLFSNFFAVELPWSPRVVWSLLDAEEQAKQRGATTIEPVDWLRAVLSDPHCRVYQVLERQGFMPGPLLQRLAGVVAEDPAAAVAVDHPREPARTVETAPHAAMVVTSGSEKIDNKAQDLARQLDGLAAHYFLATPEDRRQVMRGTLTQELRQLEPAQQKPLLEQLRRLFPLDAGSSQQVQEVQRLNNKIRQLEHRIAELEKEEGASKSGLPWHLVVESRPAADLDVLSPIDRPRLEFLRRIFEFSVNLERFIVGIVQGFVSTGAVTTSFALPGHRMSIKAYLNDMAAGRQVRDEELESYLKDIEAWLVSSLTAYSEGPKLWFEGFWQDTSPSVIERNFSRGLIFQHRELWQRYKDVTRGLSPDLVSQKIFHEVKRIAKERRNDL